MSSRKRALVTGASAGIGQAFAEQLAGDGLDLVLTARRLDRLQELADRLAAAHGVRVEAIQADLCDPDAPPRIADRLGPRGVDVLVNNAGIGIAGTFRETQWKELADFMQLMMTSVAHLTHLLLPGMVERRHGHVMQVASVAGLVPGSAGNTLYAASKSFLIRFCESLAAELDGSGVHVTALCPGYTHSEFHDAMGTRANVERLPPVAWQSAQEVAQEGLEAMRRGEVVHVTGRLNRWFVSMLRHLPQGTARSLMRSR
jgi:uncharacterized protein